MTIALVADSSAATRQAAAQMLESLGFRVVTACDAREALALTREHWPDLVLVDASLETAEGILAVTAIRKISNTCLIHVSADGGAAGVRGAMEAGADDYLVKPFDVALLRFKLGQARTRRRLRPTGARPMLVQDNAAAGAASWRLRSFGKAV